MNGITKRSLLLCTLLTIGVACTRSGPSSQQTESFTPQEQLLATLPPDTASIDLALSRNGQKVGYKIKQGEKERYVINGAEQAAFDEVGEYLYLSTSANSHAYKARDGKRWLIVFNGQTGKPYDKVGEPVLSSNGSVITYQAIRGDDHFIVINEQEQKTYEGTLPPVISPQTNKVAYGAKRGDKWFYIIDGREEPETFDRVGYLYFSEDGRKYAYEAISEKKWFAVFNGTKTEAYDDIGLYDFSPDHDIYTGTRNAQEAIVWHNKKHKKYDRLRIPVLSADGKSLAYAAKSNGQYFLVVNQREFGPYRLADFPTFSPDSKRIASVVGPSLTKGFILLDGQPWTQYNALGPPTFSPDSRRLAYSALTSDGRKNFMVVDKVKQSSFEKVHFPYWSPDSQTLAYAASDQGQEFVVINGKVGKRYDEILGLGTLHFSPDSRHIGYTARKGNEIWWVVDSIK